MKRTIPVLFRQAVDDVPGKTWLLTPDGEHTYSEALAAVERAASWLRAEGVGPGDRVLVTARNTAPYLLSWLALGEVGAVQVPVNPAGSVAELAGLLGQVRPRLVVTDGELGPTVAEALAGALAGAAAALRREPPRVDVGALFDGPADGRGPADVAPEDLAVMIPTSGTTGRSKLVMQTHLAYVMAGEGFPWWLGLTADDRLMTSLPLFHINAPAYSTLGSLAARASLVLLPRFSARAFLDSARRFGATQCNAIGAMLEILMRQPVRDDDTDHQLRLCYTGPSPARERHLQIERRFGFEVTCGYALSETPYGLVWRRGTRPYGTLGWPRQHPVLGQVNDARVMEDGRPVGPGGVGELELRNPAVMRGYFELPEETATVLVDGWLRTGDLVHGNGDGTYTFVGRRKEVIRRRGENLSPAEVEAALERHPDVAEAAVVAVPSELSEDDIKAFVVPAPGRQLDLAGLHAFAAGELARFKVPRWFEVVDELPHTPTGRLAKHRLPRERTAAEVDVQAADAPGPAGAGSGAGAGAGAGAGDAAAAPWLRTWIGSTTPDRITVAGRDLPSEIMGRLSLTELAYLLLTRREPSPGQRRLLDTVLVSLADHGFTPSSLAARLTWTGAPEAPQAAVAAGLLGAGSVLLGPAGDTARFLADAVAARLPGAGEGEGDPPGEDALAEVARALVEERRGAGARVPGLGHPVHRVEDPRTPRIYQVAGEEGLLGPHLRLLRLVAAAHAEATGRALPVNGAGAAGAALVDAGVPAGSVRAFVLIGRTAGLVAHLAEEAEHPVGMPLWLDVDRRAREGG